MSSARQGAVEVLAGRLGTPVTEADAIVMQLLAETVAEAEARTWKLAAWGLRTDAAQYPVGDPCRVTLERAARAIEDREREVMASSGLLERPVIMSAVG